MTAPGRMADSDRLLRRPGGPRSPLFWGLVLLAACAHAPLKPPCNGLQSHSGACYWLPLGEGWTLPELEAREAAWLSLMAGHPRAAAVLAGMHFQTFPEYPACGGGLPVRGCVQGPTLIALAGLPVCRAALAHELTHALLAAEGDADYGHHSNEWPAILALEKKGCPPLTGDWLEKTKQALGAWGEETE